MIELLLLVAAAGGFIYLLVELHELRIRVAALEAARIDRAEALAATGAPAGAWQPSLRDRWLDSVDAAPGEEERRAAWKAEALHSDRHLEEGEEQEEGESLGSLFERFVAGRLLIWLGGIALIVAGFFLIRHSIEIGLLTPAARMTGAAAFGLLLVGLGEVARSRPPFAEDPRVAQALVGAGIVILYAAAYGSHILYGLIGPGAASAVMVLVTAGALFLSLRHGAATALMGLIGGFLTPALVGDPDAGAVPLLLYLGLLNAALFALAWRRGWTWLAALATVLSFAWTGWLLQRPPDDALAGGVFIVLLGIGASLAGPGKGPELSWIQPAAIGLAELAFLVARPDLGLSAWTLFGALAAASLAFPLARPDQRFAPAAALALAFLLLGGKAVAAPDPHLVWVAGAITLLFGGLSLVLAAAHDRLIRTAMSFAAIAGPALILRAARPETLDRPVWGLVFLGLAAAVALLGALQRRKREPDGLDLVLTLAGAAAALLLGMAAWDLLPLRAVAGAWAAIALLAALWGRGWSERGLSLVALAAAAAAAFQAVLSVPQLWSTAAASLLGDRALASSLPGAVDALWALAFPAFLLLVLVRALADPPLGSRRALAAAAAAFAIAAAYILFKQAWDLSSPEDFVERGFAERTLITQALFLTGWMLARTGSRVGLDETQAAWLGAVVTFVAAARLIWFDMFVHNPVLDAQWVGAWPLLNLLLPAFFLSAFWLYEARRRADAATRSGFWLVAFLASLSAGSLLMVRQLFQGPLLTDFELPIGEFYGYSLAALLLSAALLLGGIRLSDKALRLAGLILLTGTIVKVFLVDASALEGLLRILSFLGLGVALIGIGRIYGPILRAESRRRAQV